MLPNIQVLPLNLAEEEEKKEGPCHTSTISYSSRHSGSHESSSPNDKTLGISIERAVSFYRISDEI